VLSLSHNNAQVLEARQAQLRCVAKPDAAGSANSFGTEVATSVHPQEISLPEQSLPPSRLCNGRYDITPARLSPPPASDIAFRHSGWLPLRRKVAAAIATEWPQSARHERFASCGLNAWVARHPDNPSDFRVQADYCHDRWCLPCARQRSRVLSSNLARATADKPCRFVTLTLRSGDEPLAPLVNKMYRCFALLRRTNLWRAKVSGGAAILEVIRGKDTPRWHPHLHILVHGSFIPHAMLKAEWLRITRDSSIVDVRPVRTQADLVRYVTKYVSKPIPAGTAHRVDLLHELVKALHKKRLCSTFGTWRGIRLTDTGPIINWVFVGSLAAIRARAYSGDQSAQAILNVLHFSQKWIDEPPDDPALWDQ
jgi:hypothetical protein